MKQNTIGSKIFLCTPALVFPKKQDFKGNPNCPYYPEPETMAKRNLKICISVSAVFFIIVITVFLTLILTIFKPKNPDIFLHPVDLKNFQLLSSNSTNAPLGMVVTIVNPNYGSFRYINSTGYLEYRNTTVAKVPLETKSVPARSRTNVSTSAGIMTEKLIDDPKFWSDIEGGTFNLTAKATLPGKVSMFNIFKLKATVHISCDISINIIAIDSGSTCVAKLKL
ncbi:hypothetical protein VNO77_36810 [Canavalia gladiata]|uniref:Late embryogenesis abundant protein LEA-2 subgroup domain-containing protein n=1 Tax=Canavalia gladiata TaxID=3824 RepID=A0AAN9PXZ5_CANGL